MQVRRTKPHLPLYESPGKKYLYDELRRADVPTAQNYLDDLGDLKKLSGNFFESESKTL